MILQKSFFYVYLVLKKHFIILLSMLKTAVQLNIFVDIAMHFLGFSKWKELHLFEVNK